jgi:hypothetical protein
LDDASIVYTVYSMMNVRIKRGIGVMAMLLTIQVVSWQIERSRWYCLCFALGRIEAPLAHYLIENKIWWDPHTYLLQQEALCKCPQPVNKEDKIRIIVFWTETYCPPYSSYVCSIQWACTKPKHK